ncbi:hypothetical protein [Methylophaga sp. OBS1]|uniref:hypothetical protein n=1 Tax=Methylophaga sp. OBS1 TaxID=2991933 RepID=UPI00225C2376|nr:hypothetical protein [Methylophaga sp. OBS1]MCX4191344.1 hypothetical protein [Methylophaga sp. OBS1]MCX4191710.1 hypothetical protein [Methylophaga sp. OBS1]
MKNREIHYRYGISYLLIIIVMLISFAYYEVPHLVERVSFALTVSSLLLAILAIFYTIISGNKQSTQLEKVIEANTTLSNSIHDIQSASSSIAHLTKDIPKQFTNIHSKIDSLSKSYQGLPKDTSEDANSNGEMRQEADLSTFRCTIARMHFAAMVVLYVFERSFSLDKPIPSEVFEELELGTEYSIGALTGYSATGLIEFKIHSDEVVPTHCAKVITENIKAELESLCEILSDSSKEYLQSKLKEVDELKDW